MDISKWSKGKKELFKGEEFKALTAPFFKLVICYSFSEGQFHIPGQKVIEATKKLSDNRSKGNFQFIEYKLGNEEFLKGHLEDAKKVWISVPEDHEERVAYKVKEANPKAKIQFL